MRSRMVVVCCAALLAGRVDGASAQSPGGEVIASVFVGSWKGSGTQQDPPGSWTIAATIAGGRPGAVVGTITYPSLQCGGDLILRDASHDRLELLETITFGDCVDQGIITLTPLKDGALQYAWREENGSMTASGSLARAMPRQDR